MISARSERLRSIVTDRFVKNQVPLSVSEAMAILGVGGDGFYALLYHVRHDVEVLNTWVDRSEVSPNGDILTSTAPRKAIVPTREYLARLLNEAKGTPDLVRRGPEGKRLIVSSVGMDAAVVKLDGGYLATLTKSGGTYRLSFEKHSEDFKSMTSVMDFLKALVEAKDQKA